MSKLTELEAADRAVKVWNEFGEPLGLKTAGWSYFSSASFVNQHNKYVSGTLGGGNDYIETLKAIREFVTGKPFEFPKNYYYID